MFLFTFFEESNFVRELLALIFGTSHVDKAAPLAFGTAPALREELLAMQVDASWYPRSVLCEVFFQQFQSRRQWYLSSLSRVISFNVLQ